MTLKEMAERLNTLITTTERLRGHRPSSVAIRRGGAEHHLLIEHNLEHLITSGDPTRSAISVNVQGILRAGGF